MEVKAISKYVRISPRKTRLVINLVRGRRASESLQLLKAMNKRAARVVAKVLHSALANARVKEVNTEALWIEKITVDGGPLYKRYMPRAMGRATMIKRPTSHIAIVLSDQKGIPEVKVEPEARKVVKEKKPRLIKMRKKGKKGVAGKSKVTKEK